MTKEEVIAIIIEFLEAYGSQVGSQKVRDLTVSEMTDENLSALIIPSTMPSTGEWVQTTLKTMMRPINNSIRDLEGLQALVEAAVASCEGAENVDAQLTGESGRVILTVTDRTGESTSKEVGWYIYRTYDSIEEMEDDAENVPEGKFVLISSDVEDPDNAKMYVRTGYEPDDPDPTHKTFKFQCDFSGAQGIKGDKGDPFTYDDFTPAQIADLKRPATEAATTITTEWQGADGQGGIKKAAQDATSAANTQAAYAEEQGDYAKAWNDHPPYVADGTIDHPGDLYYMYLWDITTSAYVRGAYVKGSDLDYSTMTAEEYERLVTNVRNSIVFATVETCESIIDEIS